METSLAIRKKKELRKRQTVALAIGIPEVLLLIYIIISNLTINLWLAVGIINANVLLLFILYFLNNQVYKKSLSIGYDKQLTKLIDFEPPVSLLEVEQLDIEKKKEVLKDLSMNELGILFLTNDKSTYSRKQIVTTKEAYYWSTIVTEIVNNTDYDELEVINKISKIIKKQQELKFDEYYTKLAPLDSNQPSLIFRDIMRQIEHDFNIKLNDIEEKTRKDFNNLVNRGLIEDPIFTSVSGISLAVLGLIPIGFTCKTKKGKVKYLSIKTVLWSFKASEVRGQRTTEMKFKVWKILKAIQGVIYNEDENK